MKIIINIFRNINDLIKTIIITSYVGEYTMEFNVIDAFYQPETIPKLLLLFKGLKEKIKIN